MPQIYTSRLTRPLEIREFRYFLNFVEPEKRDRILRFRRRDDAERSLLGEVLLRTALISQFQIPNEQMSIISGPNGKPVLKNRPDIHFNISHSGNWVVCAIDSAPIGIDVEFMKDIDLTEVAESLSLEERKHLFSLLPKDQLKYFYHLWTLKESYAKALGEGLRLPFESFTFLAGRKSIRLIHNSAIAEYAHFQSFSPDDDHVMSVCSMNDSRSVVKNIPNSELWNIPSTGRIPNFFFPLRYA